jgi:hypothetical protein
MPGATEMWLVSGYINRDGHAFPLTFINNVDFLAVYHTPTSATVKQFKNIQGYSHCHNSLSALNII